MREKRATSYDVAKLAGVSQSAVSRTFSPTGSVSRKTREKVLAAAQTLAFAPNPIAQSLSIGRSQLVGLVVTQYAQQTYPIALKSAVDVMAETSDSILLQIVDSSDRGDQAIAQLLSKRVDMIICTAGLTVAAAEQCNDAGVPLVLINRRLKVPGVDHVSSPHAAVMEEVVDMIVASGAEHTVFLDGLKESWVTAERRRGYIQACKRAGLPTPKIVPGCFDYDGGFRAVMQMSEQLSDIDAIVSANDHMAIGAIDALVYEFGLSIPEDLQIVGHDDTLTASLRPYQLTSIKQDMRRMLLQAIELAYARLKEPTRPEEDLVVNNTLVHRQTTRTGKKRQAGAEL